MALRDVAAMNASLDNDYGTTSGPNAPDSHELALFAGDPTLDGVEISGPGYARVVVSPSDWSAAAGGAKSTTTPMQFADATGAWSDVATYWCLFDGTDHTTAWDCAPLPEPLDVADAGVGPAVQPTVYYAEIVTTAE